jgi:predicted GNAT family N-acyltransferase
VRVVLFDARDQSSIDVALAIRRRVFVDEQGFPLDEEMDAHDRGDPETVHAVAFAEGVPIGAGRFYAVDPSCVQIGRMAVLSRERGKGAGRALLLALLAEARRRGYRRARLLAQLHAIPFYRAARFVAAGEPEMDGGQLHQAMQTELG